MDRIKLTAWWVLGFAILILPLQAYQYQKRQWEKLNEEITWLHAQFWNCVDLGQTLRVYLNDYDWVEFKCVHTDTNLYSRTKKVKK